LVRSEVLGRGLLSPRAVIALILLLTVCKFVVAALTPLAFDEALYWRYSKHLAAGFIDHPFMNPLMIRIGTSLFGDDPFGVRFMAIGLGLPASWAVWRAAEALIPIEDIGATAALMFNLTVVSSVGSIIATSDQLVVTAAAFILFCLAKLNQTGRGPWWLAVGAAMGVGLCCKYTTLFFGAGVLVWLAMTPGRRRWFLSPWPYAGGALALVVFSPVLLWNATHGWESFVYQSGRLTVYDWSGRYFGEFLLDLIALATPPIFILGVAGIVAKPASEPAGARALLASLMGPMLLYFAWHATHVRVQGNWPEPVYPAFSVAAAEAARRWSPGAGWLDAVARWSARLAAPIGLGIAALIYLEVTTGLIPLGAHDLRGRALGVGWPAVADQIDAVRVRSGARGILTTDYTLDGWIKFYRPSHTPVEQMDERVRWTNEPEPDPRVFSGPLIYVCDHSCWKLPRVRSRFGDVRLVATVDRLSRGRAVSHYQIYRLSNPIGPVFDVARDIPQADHND
jgi:4-amino-4-deoxy-L-arabinose transferase-like glycosyltransferase